MIVRSSLKELVSVASVVDEVEGRKDERSAISPRKNAITDQPAKRSAQSRVAAYRLPRCVAPTSCHAGAILSARLFSPASRRRAADSVVDASGGRI